MFKFEDLQAISLVVASCFDTYSTLENSAGIVNGALQAESKSCTVKLDLYPFSPYVSRRSVCTQMSY